MDENFSVLKNACVAFDEKIVEVSSDRAQMLQKYAGASIFEGGANSVLCPGLINAHTHLEYSANKNTLSYGGFLPWLSSVMDNRGALGGSCDAACMERASLEMLRSGVTSFGEISSFGADLEVCARIPQTVVFFNELIGSKEEALGAAFDGFLARFNRSLGFKSATFIPAISVHSTYSVHHANIKRATDLAREQGAPVSVHFMESAAERKWLDEGRGEFGAFFAKYMNASAPVNKAEGFLDYFDGLKTLYVHCVKANDEELDTIQAQGAFVAHCPVSNRLLGTGRLDLETLKNKEIPFCLATDGLSSNYSLNIFNELRAALLMHYDLDLRLLARDLLKSVTVNAASALGLNKGQIRSGLDADLVCFNLPGATTDETIAYELILHTIAAQEIFINGEEINGIF